jgi:hypothetical protein
MGSAVTGSDGSARAEHSGTCRRAGRWTWTAIAVLALAAGGLCGPAPALAQVTVNYLYELPNGPVGLQSAGASISLPGGTLAVTQQAADTQWAIDRGAGIPGAPQGSPAARWAVTRA